MKPPTQLLLSQEIHLKLKINIKKESRKKYITFTCLSSPMQKYKVTISLFLTEK